MVGFLAILFFSATGITLNHPTWFGGEEGASSTEKGKLPAEWVSNEVPNLDQLKIAEKLRADHRLRGMVKEFRQDEEECVIAFQGPGYSADVFISRKDGATRFLWCSMALSGVGTIYTKGAIAVGSGASSST